MNERKTRTVKVGNVLIGGDAPVSIQSMLSRRSDDIEGNIRQAVLLTEAGCEILRVSIPDKDALRLIPAIKKVTSIPLVADIHFDYRLALLSVEEGIDKIRINPGNIGDDERVEQVVGACKRAGIPIRIGVNAGSLEKETLLRYGGATPEAMVESALYHISLLERHSFEDIVVSLKASSATKTIKAYRLLSEVCNYPLHLGVTEAGTERMGLIKSSIGIGSLLCDGIGDTIRISLTADPIREIYAAKDILSVCELRREGVEVVSCPTCGRTKIDLINYAEEIGEALKDVKKPVKVAMMGCAVNGPGEAKDADIGIAGGDGFALLFKKGEVVGKIPEDEVVSRLLFEIEQM